MAQYSLRQRNRRTVVERLDLETLQGNSTYFFRDAYNMDVYFDDFDDKSSDYFRLDYDPSFTFCAGRNLIAIRGNSDTMNIGTELIIEAVDANGDIIRTQIYDLNNDAHERVISVEITPTTPAGDVIVSIVGSARIAPDGTAIPTEWRGVPNMRWTRVFTAKTHMPNKSPITYNDSLPQIEISEISKPFYKLHFNSELSTSMAWAGNETASYNLTSGYNTNCSVSYQKSGGKTFITAHDGSGGNILDFGGFTKDMEGGIIIVRNPQTPRPSGINGYSSPPVFAIDEIGDGLYEDQAYLGSSPTIPTMSFIPGGYMTTILEVVSPFEARTSEPHTTQQGLTAASYQEFEHFQFDASPFELVWSQMPISYSADPTGSQGEELRNSYALVKFDKLEPLTGDVTRIKCYMKNHQAPFDWVLASDNAIWAQELLYRKDHEKHRMPIGDMSQWGVGINTGSLEQYWETLGVGTPAPSMSIYTQGGAGENPPVSDNLQIGINSQATQLDGTAYWWLRAKESASFYEDQYYELSFKAVSVKTIVPSWNTLPQQPICEPKMKIYMTGSAFTEVATGGAALTGYGKYIGKIEDIAPRKKHVEFDQHDNEKEIGYKFLFKADGTEGGIPQFKIESGLWHLWDISIKPWDRKGFTPGTWDVIFPTIKANVGNPDALDFKFEFYNDYGQIANYTAVINKVPWVNEYTAVFTHIHTNFVQITDEVVFESTFSLFSASDGYDPTGSVRDIQTTNNWTFTGSGGVSTSLYTDPLDPGHKVLVIDGAGSGGSGGGGGWTASNGITTDPIPPNETVTWEGSGLIGVSYNGGTNKFTIATTADNYNGWNWGQLGSFQTVNSGQYAAIAAGSGVTITGPVGAGTISEPYTMTINCDCGDDGDEPGDGCTSTWPYAQGENPEDPIPGFEWCPGSLGIPPETSVPTQGMTIGCPTTLGYEVASFLLPMATAEYQSFYAEKTWLQVNNWSGPEYKTGKEDVAYAAIFNTTGVPVQGGDGGDDPCRGDTQAGHGIKIMTSTVPVGIVYKILNKATPNGGATYTYGTTCGASMYKLPGPMVGSTYLEPKAANWQSNAAGTSGLPNAYYLACYHWDYDDSANGFQTFAGGIRKHCNSYQNTIVIEYSSDRRIKEDIEETKWSVNDLMKIKVRDFHYKATPKDRRGDKETGFIAQELQEVYPQAAFGDEYGDVRLDPMTVAPDRLIPLMIKSIQDQQNIIEELSKKIESLENK